MKKLLFIIALTLCCTILSGCTYKQAQTEPEHENEEISSTTVWAMKSSYLESDHAYILDVEDCHTLNVLTSNASNGAAYPTCDFDIYFNGSNESQWAYHSECGSFVNLMDDGICFIDDTTRQVFNLSLQRYFAGCASDVKLEEPPTVTAKIDDETITLLNGAFSWTYYDGENAVSAVTDVEHPLNCKDIMPCINLTDENKYDSWVFFDFTVPPSSVTVKCWSADDWGNIDAESTAVDIDITARSTGLELKEVPLIYEVCAQWSNYPEFGGTAHYYFYTSAQVG